MSHTVEIKSVHKITHDVIKIVTTKPDGFQFNPGQATELSINRNGWKVKKHPFTMTSLPDDDYLEFMIKTYPAHKGVTNEMLSLNKGDELLVHDVFGKITYRGEGVFIAGGAGVTPFIAILRDLHKKHELSSDKLIFANKTKVDIILEPELRKLLGTNFINILSDENILHYAYGLISKEFLETSISDLDCYFYVCGPPPMISSVIENLLALGVNPLKIVQESFN